MTVTEQVASAATLAETLPSSERLIECCRAPDQDVIDPVDLGKFENGVRRIESLKNMR